MKVLMLGWELPPHNSGGLGVACYQLCKALANRGADIEFILPYSADYSHIDFMKVNPALKQSPKVLFVSGSAYESQKFVQKDGTERWVSMTDQQKAYESEVGRLVPYMDFDVVHAHDWLTFRAGIRARQLSGKPLILHVHSIESDRSGKAGGGNPLVREIEYMGFMMADRIIAVSDFTKKAIMAEYDVPEDKIDVVHNSIDRDMFEVRTEDSVHKYLETMRSQGYRVVVNIGRLTIQKGLPNLLYAAKKVIEKAPRTLFLIVGSGEQYYELIEQAAELGIGKNVIFTGFQRGQHWRDSFAAGDLFVMPSVSEPFGLTPLEAAGYGTPSLISKQSGVAEVFRNCLKVDFWDIDEMANQIVAVVKNDPLRDELQANAYKEYEKLSWYPAAEKLMYWYTHHTSKLNEVMA